MPNLSHSFLRWPAALATALALVERRLAHAEYTAPPLPVWPDSPAAEAIENLRAAN